MAVIPTSWNDLDWENPDPWDMRYYQSLVLAMHERVYALWPVAPLPENTYPISSFIGTLFNQQFGNLKVSPWRGVTENSIFNVDLFLELIQTLVFITGKTFYSSTNQTITEYRWIKDKDTFNPYSADMLSMTDILNDQNTSVVLRYPIQNSYIDDGMAKSWLIAMKAAIQPMRYFRINNANSYLWEGGIGAGASGEETISNAISNLSPADSNFAGGRQTHCFNDCWAFLKAQYWPLFYNYEIHTARRDIRWVNTLHYPVDLYVKISRISNTQQGFNDYFDDFGTGYNEGDLLNLGKVDISDGIESIFGSRLPIAANGNFDNYNYYSIAAHIIADAGPYFNFNCSE